MAKMTLLQKLVALATLDLVFIGISSTKDQNGKEIAILRLEDPIDEVRGSQELEWNGQRYPLIATDVVEIKVHQDDMNDDFIVEDDGIVTYKGSSLVLDVAKSSKQVWLRKETFAAQGNKLRTDNRSDAVAKLLGMTPVKRETPASNASNASNGSDPEVVDTNPSKKMEKVTGP